MPDDILQGIGSSFATVRELIDGGGPFVLAIFVCCVVMWTLVLERTWFFWRVLPRQIDATVAEWKARTDHRSWCARQVRTAMISRLNAAMNAN